MSGIESDVHGAGTDLRIGWKKIDGLLRPSKCFLAIRA